MHALAAFVQDYIAHPGGGVRFKESEVGAQCSSGLDEGLIVNEASEHLARFPVSAMSATPGPCSRCSKRRSREGTTSTKVIKTLGPPPKVADDMNGAAVLYRYQH